MPEQSEKNGELALCWRARQGDQAAQEAIYRRHADSVYSVAMRMLQQPQLAEEVLQETFVKVLTRLESFRGDAALSTWIRRIAVNECLQLIRSPWRKRGEPLVEEPNLRERPDRGIDIERALARLPALTRVVVWLHDVEGYTHREIADLLGQSASFSKSRLARGHRAMRDELERPVAAPACIPALHNS